MLYIIDSHNTNVEKNRIWYSSDFIMKGLHVPLEFSHKNHFESYYLENPSWNMYQQTLRISTRFICTEKLQNY